MIEENEARKIAEAHASAFYRDLSVYSVKVLLKEGKWFIDFDLDNPTMVGGGPHYTIDAETGKILSTRFEQ
jgi:hypothetical protein